MKHGIRMDATGLASEFHNTYEEFARNNGWKTQDSCHVPFDNLPKKNKETMIDTCQHIICWLECFIEHRGEEHGDKPST